MFFHKPKHTGDLRVLKIRVWNSMSKRRDEEGLGRKEIYAHIYT